jgi:hypothetical protein
VKQAFGVVILATAAYYGYQGYELFANRWVEAGAVASSVEEKVKSGWHASLAEGLATAQREKKPVLIDLWATWCNVRDLPLNADNIAALQSALADTAAYEQAFVLIHHLLWWEDSAPWWRDVHPLMVGRKVRAVIGGDFGPMKFSHERRDGIDYIQTSIEGLPGARLLRKRMDSRLLSQQFDNYLSVRVNGREVAMEVRPVGAIASGKFTPQRWREINQHTPSRREQMQAVWAAVRPPKRLALLVAALVVVFGAGFAAARMIPRARR